MIPCLVSSTRGLVEAPALRRDSAGGGERGSLVESGNAQGMPRSRAGQHFRKGMADKRFVRRAVGSSGSVSAARCRAKRHLYTLWPQAQRLLFNFRPSSLAAPLEIGGQISGQERGQSEGVCAKLASAMQCIKSCCTRWLGKRPASRHRASARQTVPTHRKDKEPAICPQFLQFARAHVALVISSCMPPGLRYLGLSSRRANRGWCSSDRHSTNTHTRNQQRE
jgi:hypothetical protein